MPSIGRYERGDGELGQLALRALHAFEERHLAVLVAVDADTEVDLVRIRIGVEGLGHAEDGVARRELDRGEKRSGGGCVHGGQVATGTTRHCTLRCARQCARRRLTSRPSTEGRHDAGYRSTSPAGHCAQDARARRRVRPAVPRSRSSSPRSRSSLRPPRCSRSGRDSKVSSTAASAPATRGELDRTLALMLVVVAVMAGATFTRFYFVSWIGERVTADLRRAVFDHLLTLPPGFYEATRTGDVISRLINDTAMLETVIGSSASMAIRNLLLLDRRAHDAGDHERQADAAGAGGRAGGRRPDHSLRTPGAQARAGEPGSRRRCRRVRGRGAARDPHRPGVRPRAGRPAALRASASKRRSARRSRASSSARCWWRR